MNYNPYAAPQAAPPPAPGGPTYVSSVQPWEVGEVLTAAWEAFKPNWAVLVFSYLLLMLVQMGVGQLPNILIASGTIVQGSDEFWVSFGVTYLLTFVIHALFYPGMIKIWLDAARGREASFGDLFGGMRRTVPFFGLYLLFMLLITVGFALFVAPGVFLLCSLAPAFFFLVDAEMGPIDSLIASWKATDGHRLKLFLLWLLSFVLIFAGVLACCLGWLVTVPITMVAYAIVYVRISGRGVPSAFAPPPGYGGPPPGYGAPPGGYGGPPGGGYGGPPGGGYGGPPGGGYGGPPGGGGYGPPGGGGGYGPPGGGGYGPPGGTGGPPGGGYGQS